MNKHLALAALFLGLFTALPAQADGRCGMLYTMERFQAVMETNNPGIEFHPAWSLMRPRQAGYYYNDDDSLNPDKIATIVLIEYGCVTLQVAGISEVEK